MGSSMPMKIVPMNPATTNSISGSAKATAVFNSRSRSPSVTTEQRYGMARREDANAPGDAPVADEPNEETQVGFAW